MRTMQEATVDGVFEASRGMFEELAAWLGNGEAAGLTHARLEDELTGRGRELLRQLQQDHLDLRTARERRLEKGAVVDADGVDHRNAEAGRARAVTSVFGDVTFSRIAYRAAETTNLHPGDGALNLPAERHSHGLRKLAAVESARGSYDDAVAAVVRATGVRLGKRQLVELAGRAAVDVDSFYTQRTVLSGGDDVLVLSCDGKGIVMRPGALREATARKATSAKLATRLSKGEKRNRKRMAEIGAVYDITAAPRTPADIITLVTSDTTTTAAPTPVAANKWLTASVVGDAATVIAAVFDEATRRDPDHTRTWVALVDGNNHQIRRIRAEARARGVTVTIIVDLIHVIEYLWQAAWCFHSEGDPATETWVATHVLNILRGNAGIVAAAIRRKATTNNLTAAKRAAADTSADYLHAKKPYLDYPTALAEGWPIATGVIEGACRHLVKDRMDITGARWGLDGAETVLKLRTIISNGDLDTYWTYHLNQEQHRVHNSQYLADLIPAA
jgi:hypothetical protein